MKSGPSLSLILPCPSLCVCVSQVRAPPARRPYPLDSRLNRPLARHAVGTRVEFLYHKGPIWQPGRVMAVHNDGTYDIR